MMQKNKKRAFTLIELLVVVSIIGMLSSVVLVSLNTARAKGRDAARVQAVSQVRSALELYASSNNGIYPNSTEYSTLESLVETGGPLNTYLKSLPANMSSVGATQYSSDGTYYELYVTSESGGQFAKNIGCDTGEYVGYDNDKDMAYCISNGAAISAGDGGVGGESFSIDLFYIQENSAYDPNESSYYAKVVWTLSGVYEGVECNITAYDENGFQNTKSSITSSDEWDPGWVASSGNISADMWCLEGERALSGVQDSGYIN